MQYKVFRPELTVIDEGRGAVMATMSDESRDRDGDVIRASGWNLDDFLAHPVLLSSHNYGSLMQQIGKWNSTASVDGKLMGEAEYFIGSGNAEADWGFELARRGQAAYSVGFIPGEAKKMKGGGTEYISGHRLLETSHVTVPSNPSALQAMARTLKGMPGMAPVMEIIEEMAHEQLATVKAIANGQVDIKTVSDEFLAQMNSHLCQMPFCDCMDVVVIALCRQHIAAFYELVEYGSDQGESDAAQMLPMPYAMQLPPEREDSGTMPYMAPAAMPYMAPAAMPYMAPMNYSFDRAQAKSENPEISNPVVMSLDLAALLTRSFAEVR